MAVKLLHLTLFHGPVTFLSIPSCVLCPSGLKNTLQSLDDKPIAIQLKMKTNERAPLCLLILLRTASLRRALPPLRVMESSRSLFGSESEHWKRRANFSQCHSSCAALLHWHMCQCVRSIRNNSGKSCLSTKWKTQQNHLIWRNWQLFSI